MFPQISLMDTDKTPFRRPLSVGRCPTLNATRPLTLDFHLFPFYLSTFPFSFLPYYRQAVAQGEEQFFHPGVGGHMVVEMQQG